MSYGRDIWIKSHKKSEKFVLEYFLNGTRREIEKELKIRNIRSIRKAIKVAKEIEEENNTRSKDKETAASFKQKSDDNKNNYKVKKKKIQKLFIKPVKKLKSHSKAVVTFVINMDTVTSFAEMPPIVIKKESERNKQKRKPNLLTIRKSQRKSQKHLTL